MNFGSFAKQLYILPILLILSGCGQSVPPHLKSLPASTIEALAVKGMTAKDPIFIRIFKQESELEVWKLKKDGRFHLFKIYAVCKWSGKIGPKIRQGDKQAPEGFYTVTNKQMNPNSKYHLSFNLGFPNAYDKAHKRTGNYLMVHGNCESKGCYAMTDAVVEELYLLARDAFIGGQKAFHVHAFPFRMTDKNMKAHAKHKWIRFWRKLKEGYDHFEYTRQSPKIHVCNKNYLINASFYNKHAKIHSTRPCPAYKKRKLSYYFESSLTAKQSKQNHKHLLSFDQ